MDEKKKYTDSGIEIKEVYFNLQPSPNSYRNLEQPGEFPFTPCDNK